MTISRWTGARACGLALASFVSLCALSIAADEPTAPVVAKKTVDPTRRVPPLFGQVGLTPEQKEEIYKIRAKHQAQIDALHKQLVQAQADQLADCEAVLTDAQKQLLTLRREAAARARASRHTATVTPVSSKSEEKPGN